MDFKNKISTSIEQSKELLELGLKPETADMCYHCDRSGVFGLNTHSIKLKSKSLFYKVLMSDYGEQEADKRFEELYGSDIPAWSLSRLIELMPKYIIGKKSGIFYYPYFNIVDNIFFYYDDVSRIILHQDKGSTPLDAALNMIDYLIKNNYFNKEYLDK